MAVPAVERILRQKLMWIALWKALRRILEVASIVLLAGYTCVLVAAYYSWSILPSLPFRIWLLIAAGLPLAAGLSVFVTGQRDFHRLVLKIEDKYPQLMNRLLTSIEVLHRDRSVLAHHPFSRQLALSLERQVSSLLKHFHFESLGSVRLILGPLVFLLILCGLMTAHVAVDKELFVRGLVRLGLIDPAGALASRQEGVLFEVSSELGFKVLPGDCSLQKGGNLTVRLVPESFSPTRAELHFKPLRSDTWQIFPMTAVGSGEFELLLTHITEASVYFVAADGRESSLFRIDPEEALALERFSVRIEYPHYMNLEAQTRQGWTEKLTIPAGAQLKFDLEFNRPVAFAQLLVEGGIPIKLSEVSKLHWTALLAPTQDLTIGLDARDAKGERAAFVPAMWIELIPDLPPYLEVIEPQVQSSVFATQEVPFVVSVNDDYGLRSVTLVLKYGQETRRIALWREREGPAKELRLERVLELEKVGIRYPDIVFAFIEAEDRFTGELRHLVRSELLTLLVRPFVEYFELNPRGVSHETLRALFEDILIAQERVTKSTWELLNAREEEF